MPRAGSLLATGLLVLGFPVVSAIEVDVLEVLTFDEAYVLGEYTLSGEYEITNIYGGVDPIDSDCYVGKCAGLLTRDGSMEADSHYGCTKPLNAFGSDDDYSQLITCGVEYALSEDWDVKNEIGTVKVAIGSDSVSTLRVLVDGDVVVDEWEATPGSAALEEIPGLDGVTGHSITIQGVMDVGDYLSIVEAEVYLIVDEVEASGVSASTRATITATATTDATSAMSTVDGDATDSSSWACMSGEVCEITYDLESVESLEQLRIAFSSDTDDGGEFNVMAAGGDGEFYSVRTDIEAGGRPAGSDGLQTFGNVRALTRYVKIEAVPATGGKIGINEVEFRVNENAPERPVAEKAWLKTTGMLPLGADAGQFGNPSHDVRSAADGGCDSPGHFDGCHVYYVKDGDMDTRWSCGPLTTDEVTFSSEICQVDFSLNYFRYVRQIQIAFHLGDEQYHEFSIEANTVLEGWKTIVPSAISSGATTEYQTFNVNVHAKTIKLVPKFQKLDQYFSVKEIIFLEKRKNDFIAGTIPVFSAVQDFPSTYDDSYDPDPPASTADVPTRFKFDIPVEGDKMRFDVTSGSTVTALRVLFPKDRVFVFNVEYYSRVADAWVSEEFTSAGTLAREWETFTLSEPIIIVFGEIEIVAVSGPSFDSNPDYPTLRVIDFQIMGDINKPDDYLEMVTTTTTEWGVVPDIIGDGVSEQVEIMTAICEHKGATYDGVDCVGELNDATLYIHLALGNFFMDGPVYLKSGITLSGGKSDDAPGYTFWVMYDGENTGNTAEDALLVIDGVIDAEVEFINFQSKSEATGDVVDGSLGNLCMDVRNSEDLRFTQMEFGQARAGGARFTDVRNVSTFFFWAGDYETGNYMELTRVDDFYVKGFPNMKGLRMEDCTDIFWEGYDDFETPNPALSPPTGGDQTANVVITGASSGITIANTLINGGAEPRILMESTEPLTLDFIEEYSDAVSGDCIVEVPAGTTDDLIVQVNSEQTLSKSGTCWVLD